MKRKNAFLMSMTTVALLAFAPKSGLSTQATDPENFGPPEAMLFWTLEQKVAGFRNMDKMVWTRKISASDDPLPLKDAPADLSDVQLRYNGAEMTINAFLNSEKVAGLLIIQDGAIAYEYHDWATVRIRRGYRFRSQNPLVRCLLGPQFKMAILKALRSRLRTICLG